MKHLLIISALFISSLAMGQNDPFWNPDANGDDLIGFTDLASLLSVYNSSIGLDSSVTCDFNGTDLEQLFLDLVSQTAILDSVFFECALSGLTNEYTLGCPDPIQVPWSYSASGTCTNPDIYTYSDSKYISCYRSFPSGGSAEIYFYSERYCPTCPYILNGYLDSDVSNPPISGGEGFWFIQGTNVPFQNSQVTWDSLGIHQVEMDPSNFIRAIPYWHYAE
ncbi:MAG: hypothetical protein O2990_07880 [Bacteroidetes bacterium]|nr:hypothetical protein [Bacteroidota bacterium]